MANNRINLLNTEADENLFFGIRSNPHIPSRNPSSSTPTTETAERLAAQLVQSSQSSSTSRLSSNNSSTQKSNQTTNLLTTQFLKADLSSEIRTENIHSSSETITDVGIDVDAGAGAGAGADSDEQTELQSVLKKLQAGDFSWLKANPRWYENLETAKTIIQSAPLAFGYIPKSNFNLDFIIKAVTWHPTILGVVPNAFHEQFDITARAVITNPDSFEYAHPDYKCDSGMTTIAVNHNGLFLRHTSDSLKDSQIIVQAAVENNGLALQFASNNLKNNKSIVQAAVENNGLALQFASDALKKDPEIIHLAIENNLEALQFVPSALQEHFTPMGQAGLTDHHDSYKPPALKRLRRGG